MNLTRRANPAALTIGAFCGSAGVALAQLGPPIIDYLEIDTLTPHHRLSVHGFNLEQSAEISVGGIPAIVVPIPGTNAVKMNAYIPADVPFGMQDVVVTTSVGESNPLTLNVVPRAPEGRTLWRFFMNNQVMLHRPAIGADGTIYARSQAGDLTAISPQGEYVWQNFLGVDLTPTVDVGHDGTIYTANGSPTIFAVNPDGTVKWSWTDPLSNQGIIAGPNVGPDGNVYAVTHRPGTGVVSLDPQGNVRWTAFSGADNPYWPIGQKGQEIVFSDTQLFFCQFGNFDSFTFDGDHVFRFFTVTQNSDDSPQPAVGPNGDSYVEEWSLLHSLDPGGSLNWTAFSPPGSYLRDPDVGPDGTIYVMRNVFNTFHALNPDGSTKWTYNHPETLLNPVASPMGETILIGGGSWGNAFYLAFDEFGSPTWQIDLPVEELTPFETVQAFPQGRARFTPDGSVAYVMASSTPNSGGHCYLYAVQVGDSVDIGHGMQGTQGMPRLETTGALEAGNPVTVTLTDARPSTTAFLVVGLDAAATPFAEGVVLPSQDALMLQQTDASGTAQFTVNWPNLPSQTSICIQYWIPDPAGPQGWASSNAVSLITP